MRKRTAAIVSLASAATIAASWAAGLEPHRPTLSATGGSVVSSASAVVSADPPARVPKSSVARSGSAKAPGSTKKAPTASATTAPVRSGRVDGAVVSTRYGNVQVRLRFVGSKITNVTALHLTDSSGTSVAISQQAAPILRHEALAAQTAQIDMVSGATYTSGAYQQSLQSAIDAAHLG